MKNDLLKGLTEEQIAKVRECKSEEELLELARKEGVKLTDEQLEQISGGACSSIIRTCPWCGSYFAVQRSGEYFYCAFCSCQFTANGEIVFEGYKDKRR